MSCSDSVFILLSLFVSRRPDFESLCLSKAQFDAGELDMVTEHAASNLIPPSIGKK
jgi:hypothetical protein